jgi:hypothetical protein
MLRWLIFLFIGIPVQLLVYCLYPFIYGYWRFKVYKKVTDKSNPHHEKPSPGTGKATLFNNSILDNTDDHGALSMYGFINREGLALLQNDGNFIRKRNADNSLNTQAVSGDVVVAWCFANILASNKADDAVLKSLADNYIKNLGTLSYDNVANGYVSARCSNFGVNLAKDSDVLGLSQPAAGPQFYTNCALFASAYHLGFKYKLIFWAHWLLMGGWYWAFAPVLYPDYDSLWYVRDITMKALYVNLQVFGPKWWITKPMKFITDKTCTYNNDLFNAMLGRNISELPEAMDCFFSQRENASSEINDRMSAYIPQAIRDIKKNTRFKD